MDVYVITENNSVVILSSRVGSRVYSILRRKFVFDEPIPDRDPFTFYEPRDADWVVFNSNALFNKATSYGRAEGQAPNEGRNTKKVKKFGRN
ncbi:unnamed protein product [Bursaphelenchus okinawaensis]|uniref:Uncharacterized protein n=1 Tax=Bursaphelenchus okinawaensis TaxID=465554 RepID=A0A811JTV5_9BILA|nr:unnamed protein product [Bursaphelenchus okinawaensis]CAG9082707.1 unnamed protein product [Bursaphelenchus okinawaensis]